MTNLKLADELFTIRAEIKRLQARETEIKDALSAPGADLAGLQARVKVLTDAFPLYPGLEQW